MGATAKLELILELKNRLMGGFGKAKQYVNSELKSMKDNVNSFKSSVTNSFKGFGDNFKGVFKNLKTSSSDAFEAIKSEVPGVSRAIGLLTNPYALAAVAALAMGAGIVKATSMAMDWKKSIAEVNVTAQLSQKELGKLSDKLLTIGANGSVELEQVPMAFNRIISAGLNVNESLKALEPTLKAAKAGFTDIETVAAAGIGVMKSSGEDILTVYDVLFATLNKGNAKFKDIAQYLPKIIPGAKQAGFALQETAGAWAYLTAQGQTAEQSTTGLMNAFKSLSNPDIIYGTKTKGGFKKLGVDVFDATGKMRPLVAIIEDLSKVMNGLTDEKRIKKFASIGLDMEAAGAFASMTQNVKELKSTIDFTTNSTGQLEEAVKNSATGTEGWTMGMNKLKKMAIDFGGNFLPIVDKAGAMFNFLMEKVQQGVTAFKELYNSSVLLQDVLSFIGDKWVQFLLLPFKLIGAVFNMIKTVVTWVNDNLGVVDKVTGALSFIDDIWIKIKANAAGVFGIFNDLMSIIEPIGKAITSLSNPAELVAALKQARAAFSNFSFADSFNKGYSDSINTSLASKKASEESLNPTGVSSPIGADKSDNLDGSTEDAQVNGGTPQKYINITVGALHQGDNILQQTANNEGMTLEELEKKMNEIWLRLLRNSNAAY